MSYLVTCKKRDVFLRGRVDQEPLSQPRLIHSRVALCTINEISTRWNRTWMWKKLTTAVMHTTG